MILKIPLKSPKGEANVFIILAIIIAASFFLVGGLSPKINQTATSPEEGAPEMSSSTPGERNSLQLETLKFSKKCSEQITLDLLLDRTGSMNSNTPTGQTKIARLKEAVLALTEGLSDLSIIGIQSFNSQTRTDDVPISYYRDVKEVIPSRVNALNAGGQTPTHDALVFSLDKLREAIPRFPGRQFNFILVSDGQPVPDSQNPRDSRWPTNPADEIKNLGVNVYTLGIFTSGQASNPKLAELLKSIASKPENYYEAQTGDQTTKLLEVISARICDQAT